MGDVHLWWRMPGERDVMTLRPASDGAAVFHFAPFVNDLAHPDLAFRGHPLVTQAPKPGTLTLEPATDEDFRPTTRTEHVAAIRASLLAIARRELEKVVLSRIEVIPPGPSTPEAAFAAKCAEFPDAFVYLLQHPAAGTWTGATPELLLKRDGDAFETVALAGTRRVDVRTEWTAKERNEQAVVVDYIERVLQRLGIREVVVGTVRDRLYGRIAHLESQIRFHSSQPLTHIARALHPTPAVGGAPLAAALRFIAATERRSRGYYSGFLGIDTPTAGALFVNLRCMQWLAEGVRVHAGGGIVDGSDPDSEWEETEAKIASILSGLRP